MSVSALLGSVPSSLISRKSESVDVVVGEVAGVVGVGAGDAGGLVGDGPAVVLPGDAGSVVSGSSTRRLGLRNDDERCGPGRRAAI